MTPIADLTPTPPIVLQEDQDVLLFRSIQAAEWFVEGWLVREGRLRGFDAIGRELRFEVTSHHIGGWLGRLLNTSRDETRIGLASDSMPAENELRVILSNYLIRATRAAPETAGHIADLPLDELVHRAAEYAQR